MTNHDVFQKFFVEVQRNLVSLFGIGMDEAAIIAADVTKRIVGISSDLSPYQGDKDWADRAARLTGRL